MPPTQQTSDDLNDITLQPVDIAIEIDKIEPNGNSHDQEISFEANDLVTSTIVIDNDSSENKSLEEENDVDYFVQFSCPDDSDDESEYFYEENNNDIFLHNHLNRKQLDFVDDLEEQNYERSKRSNKKMSAKSQIKDKYAKSIKNRSRHRNLYIHHRLVKIISLDPPTRNHKDPSEQPKPTIIEKPLSQTSRKQPRQQNQVQQTQTPNVPQQFVAYTINEQTLQHDTSFDDAMIAFLLDMQNRDLSPNDYEMLLRLDERVQHKTVDVNVLKRLPTTDVNETHLNEICAICIESYTLGQQIKTLPCAHIFHLHCIETYLKDFSVQCPLDNLPLA